jgi:hypothetical protein
LQAIWELGIEFRKVFAGAFQDYVNCIYSTEFEIKNKNAVILLVATLHKGNINMKHKL